MLTRRGFEVVIVAIVLTKPVFGCVKLWAVHRGATAAPGSLTEKITNVAAVLF